MLSDNKKTYTGYQYYFLRLLTGLGRGFYWGLSVFNLVFGIFIGKFAGLLGRVLPGTVGAIAAFGYILRNFKDEWDQQNDIQKLKTLKKDLKNGIQAEIERVKQSKTLNENAKKKILAYLNEITKLYDKKKPQIDSPANKPIKGFFQHAREFFNSSKDIAKGLIGVGLFFGFSIPPIMMMTSSFVFASFLLSIVLFSAAVTFEFHIKGRQKNKIRNLEKKVSYLNDQILRVKYRKSKPKEISNLRTYLPTEIERQNNWIKLGIATVYGAMHGGYFGFTMCSLFGLLFAPITTPFIPLTLSLVLMVAMALRQIDKELDDQGKEKNVKSACYNQVIKWGKNTDRLEKQNIKCKLLSSKYYSTKKPASKFHKTFHASTIIIEIGRSLKNASKLIIGILSVMGYAVAGSFGFMGTFGTLPLAGLLIFAGAFALLGVVLCSWQEKRNENNTEMKTRTRWLKRDSHKMKRKLHEKNKNDLSTGLTLRKLHHGSDSSHVKKDKGICAESSLNSDQLDNYKCKLVEISDSYMDHTEGVTTYMSR